MSFSPLCALDPLIKAGRIFGLQLIRPCSCHRRHSAIFDCAYRVYVFLVEVLLWSIAAKLVVDTLHEEVLCAGWSSVYGHGAHIVKMTFVVVDLYVAIQFGIVKRNVFRWTTRKVYPNEERHFENMESIVYLGLVQLFVWLMVLSVNLDLMLIPAMKTRVSDPWILLLCSLWNGLWQIYTFGQLLFLFFFMAILFNLIFERLKYIEYELASLGIFSEKLKIRLEDVMDRHQEMCDTFREINNSWNNLTPVLYLVLSHLTCYLWYIFLFSEMPNKELLGFGAVFCAVGCILIASLLSRFASMIYSNFIQIGRFSSSDLPMDFKLKILTFIKRFGTMPLGISVGGFFYVKKHFLMKFAHSLYSVFSSLLQLKDMTTRRKCYVTSTRNVTSFDVFLEL